MTKKKDDKRIGGVTSATKAAGIERLKEVDRVSGVQRTEAVSGVRRAGGIARSRLTAAMSAAEREALFRMIQEETDKIYEEGGLPEKQKEIVKQAVKMAVEAGLIGEEEESANQSSKNKGNK
jgi:hypothetical protein